MCKNKTKKIKELIPEYFSLMNQKKLSRILTGFKNLDKITSGLQNSELIIVGACSGMGKTALILSAIKHIAIDSNITTAIFLSEESSTTFIDKLIANISEIDIQSISKGKLYKQEQERIEKIIKDLEKSPIYIDDTSQLSIQDLCEKAHKLVLENNVKIIFIDHVQILSMNDKFTKEHHNDINFISRKLKALAEELNIPIVVTSQLPSDLKDRPRLTDLQYYGTLCDDANVVCFIYKPEYYKTITDCEGNIINIVEVIVAKSSNNTTGNVYLKFERAYAKFENLEKETLI
ncbi:MAG TPA: DnaB-like helicase C-terminal domain-containing protein [Bacteroidales bacterium]|nr:DnaB-like helicase C-terminal domain-containing protein [Bacteroidales bacterium]